MNIVLATQNRVFGAQNGDKVEVLAQALYIGFHLGYKPYEVIEAVSSLTYQLTTDEFDEAIDRVTANSPIYRHRLQEVTYAAVQ